MRKLLSLILCLILCLSLFACNTEEMQTTTGTKDTQTTQHTEVPSNTKQTNATLPPLQFFPPEEDLAGEENSSTEKITPIISKLQVPVLDSHIKTETIVTNKKIELKGNIICATISQAGREYALEKNEKYNSTILGRDLNDLKKAIENLNVLEKHDFYHTPPIGDDCPYYIDIYFDNDTYISFGIGETYKYLCINNSILYPEDRQQAQNILSCFAFPLWKNIPFNTQVTIKDNYMSLGDEISKIIISQRKYTDVNKYIEKSFEYSEYNAENDILNEIIASCETIRLDTSLDVIPGSSIDYNEFYFYYEDESSFKEYCMVISAFEIDGTHYFKINGDYYAVDDSVIEELYSLIVFSF